MSDAQQPSDPEPHRRRDAQLETVHHEIRTALTVLRSNVELVRVELRHGADSPAHTAVKGHLGELDVAVERLKRLAEHIRTWHAGDGAARDACARAVATDETTSLSRTMVEP